MEIPPAKGKPIAKHVHEDPVSGDFDQNSLVGKFLYFAGHDHPDTTYPVKFACRYIICPKLMHKQALKQNGYCFKATGDNELITKPSKTLLKIGSLSVAEFAGMYSDG